jgi:capsular exopolysaccharide synthesis family protein
MQAVKSKSDVKKSGEHWQRGNGYGPLARNRKAGKLLRAEEVLRSAPVREALRNVYDRILAACPAEGGMFSVTSAVSGEGKTVVAVALAQLMAEDLEKTIIIIDGNLQNPRVHDLLGIPLVPGLAECIRGECGTEAVTQVGHLWVLPAGREANPSRLTRSVAAGELVDQMRKAFDIAIMDLPSLSSVSDARVMATWADAHVMVVRADSTPASTVASALESIDRDKLLGVVLNQQTTRIPAWLERLL